MRTLSTHSIGTGAPTKHSIGAMPLRQVTKMANETRHKAKDLDKRLLSLLEGYHKVRLLEPRLPALPG